MLRYEYFASYFKTSSFERADTPSATSKYVSLSFCPTLKTPSKNGTDSPFSSEFCLIAAVPKKSAATVSNAAKTVTAAAIFFFTSFFIQSPQNRNFIKYSYFEL